MAHKHRNPEEMAPKLRELKIWKKRDKREGKSIITEVPLPLCDPELSLGEPIWLLLREHFL